MSVSHKATKEEAQEPNQEITETEDIQPIEVHTIRITKTLLEKTEEQFINLLQMNRLIRVFADSYTRSRFENHPA